MTYQGHVENGAVVLDEPVTLPDGAKVEVAIVKDTPPPHDGKSFAEWVVDLANSIPEEDVKQMPTDGSVNHDHYLYGAPKREP